MWGRVCDLWADAGNGACAPRQKEVYASRHGLSSPPPGVEARRAANGVRAGGTAVDAELQLRTGLRVGKRGGNENTNTQQEGHHVLAESEVFVNGPARGRIAPEDRDGVADGKGGEHRRRRSSKNRRGDENKNTQQ